MKQQPSFRRRQGSIPGHFFLVWRLESNRAPAPERSRKMDPRSREDDEKQAGRAFAQMTENRLGAQSRG
jgi:hypothetical protein